MSPLNKSRWEKQRGNWLSGHQRRWSEYASMSDQRMAGRLKRRAAQLQRRESGAAESGMNEAEIPWIGARFIAHGDDPKEKFFRCLTLAVVTVGTLLLAGPAIIAAKVLYGLQWLLLPLKNKPLRRLPWYIAAGIAAVIGPFVVPIAWFVLITPWPPSVSIDREIAGPMYLWAQITLAFLLTGWRIRNGGWPGVKVAKKSKRLPDMPDAPSTKPVPVLPSSPAAQQEEEEEAEELEEELENPAFEALQEEPAGASRPLPAMPMVENYKKES